MSFQYFGANYISAGINDKLNHYKTFPILEQSASELTRRLPNVKVIEPEVLRIIEL